MAVLLEADRVSVWSQTMEDVSLDLEQFGALTKAELRAAVDAIDQWLSDNQASANSALPQPARAELTTAQKARMTSYVIEKRYIKGV